jgi:hypothetical protein
MHVYIMNNEKNSLGMSIKFDLQHYKCKSNNKLAQIIMTRLYDEMSVQFRWDVYKKK